MILFICVTVLCSSVSSNLTPSLKSSLLPLAVHWPRSLALSQGKSTGMFWLVGIPES